MSDAPLTSVHVFGVPTRRVPRALAHVALDRRRLRVTPGLRFWKVLGTADGHSFRARDANMRRWAIVSVWHSTDALDRFEHSSPVVRGWARLAEERWRARLRPLRARGRWSGHEPFGSPGRGGAGAVDTSGFVAALTRARLRPSRLVAFWRAVPPVAADVARAPGLRLSLGIGEAPVGVMGTFSVWQDQSALEAFAFRGSPHREVVRRTATVGWYAEELFARFEVLDAHGTVDGTDPLAP